MFGLVFVLLLVIKNAIFQEKCYKKNILIFINFNDIKSVFILFIKVIALFVKVSIVQVEILNFKKLFNNIFLIYKKQKNSIIFQVYLHKPLK